MKTEIKVVPNIPDKELQKTIDKLEKEGYKITQRKRQSIIVWTLMAKLVEKK